MKVLRSITLLVVVVFAVSAFAQSNIGLMGVGAKAGFVDLESNIGSTIAFGAAADLGQLKENINLEAEIMFWSKGHDESYWEWSYSQVYISALAKYCFESKGKGSKLTPYAGGGLGLVIGKSTSKYTGPNSAYYHDEDTSNSDTEIGLHFVGGAYYPLTPQIKGYGEARYSTGGVDFWGVFVGAIYSLK